MNIESQIVCKIQTYFLIATFNSINSSTLFFIFNCIPKIWSYNEFTESLQIPKFWHYIFGITLFFCLLKVGHPHTHADVFVAILFTLDSPISTRIGHSRAKKSNLDKNHKPLSRSKLISLFSNFFVLFAAAK